MGAAPSRPRDLMGAHHGAPSKPLESDLSQLEAFRSQPPVVQEHFQGQVDGMLALAVGFENLCDKIDRNLLVVLTTEERSRLRVLNQEKELLLLDISMFLNVEKLRYQRILVEMGGVQDGSNLSDLLRNSKTAEQVAKLQSLAVQLRGLREKYSELHDHIEVAMSEDGRVNKKAAKVFLGVLSGVVAACGVALLIVAHFIPGLNIVLLFDEVAMIAAGCAVLAAVAVKCLSKDEADRGRAYLEKVEASLENLQHQIVKVAALEAVLADESSRACWQELVQQILAQIDRVLELCAPSSSR